MFKLRLDILYKSFVWRFYKIQMGLIPSSIGKTLELLHCLTCCIMKLLRFPTVPHNIPIRLDFTHLIQLSLFEIEISVYL